MPEPEQELHRATQGSGVRAYDPATQSVIVVPPERFHDDYTNGRINLLSESTYTMRDRDGGVWEVPAAEVDEALGKGAVFGTKAERVEAAARAPGAAWTAVGDAALNALAFGAGDALQVRAFQRDPAEIDATRAAHPTAATAGAVLGAAGNLALTGGLGAGGGVAGRAATAGLAARGAPGALARVAGGAVEGAVEGTAYGLGTAVSEEALGHTDDVAQSLLANAGAGALLGGSIGLGLRGTGEALRWSAGRARARVQDFAELVRRASGKDPPRGVADVLKLAAEGRQIDDGAVNLVSTELRNRLTKLAPVTAARATNPTDAAFNALFTKRGLVDSGKVFRFVKRLGAPGNESDEAALDTFLATRGDAAGDVHDVLAGARTVAGAKRSFDAQLARESAMGDQPVWLARAAAYSLGSMSGVPGAGAVAGIAAGVLANRALRPAHAQLQRAAVARHLSDLTESMHARARRLVGDRTLSVSAIPMTRLLAPTAVMLGDGSDEERARAYVERVEEVHALNASPAALADRLEAVTAHLGEGLPATRAVLMSTAASALAYLAANTPASVQPDHLATAPAVPPHERTRFARLDAALQEPLRVMDDDATPEEHAAVAAVYPRLHAEMQRAVAEAAAKSERVSWDTRRRLALLWGASTHDAFERRHLAALQAAATSRPARGPGRPPTPPQHPRTAEDPAESP